MEIPVNDEVTSASIQPSSTYELSNLVIMVIIFAFMAVVLIVSMLYYKRKIKSVFCHLFPKSPSISEHETAQIAMEGNPPYNPYWQEKNELIQPLTSNSMRPNEERPLERGNNVQAQPINDPSGENFGEGLNSSDTRWLSDVPSDFEGNANNGVFTGANDGVRIELSNYRNGGNSVAPPEEASNQTEQLFVLPTNTSPISDGGPLSIKIEPDGSHYGSEEDTGERCYENVEFDFQLHFKKSNHEDS